MDITASYALDDEQASAAVDSLRKFEFVRVVPGVVVCVVALAVVNSLDNDPTLTTVANVILVVVLVTFLVLSAGWLHTRRARAQDRR